ncbi:hypothetical protein ACIRTV_18220 [Pseudomonas aeruginosa]|uniref:hypothetical protein n=1 Tax=Pseudomonas aeruginosa TaxID=287 RepID=UPI0018C7366C|nr:hypothetical protein [Pseudomonas aeruginosa]HBO8952117.1 hypothetical protein [Pseudomonas aeruginosa]HBO9216542.1 hypothetical protein [Pseudomonas aeruginosa]HEO1712352.1 hypothetical protein [Pseudomonas aeruginosa]
MPNRYLTAIYTEGGRALPCLDCWGLTLIARVELFGLPMLTDFGGVTRRTPVTMQRACDAEIHRALEQCEPGPGVIAAAYRGRLLDHVGLLVEVDVRLRVLEINPGSGVSLTPLQKFSDKYSKVVFYRDRNLPIAP